MRPVAIEPMPIPIINGSSNRPVCEGEMPRTTIR